MEGCVYCQLRDEMPVAKGVLSGETLNTTDNYMHLTDKGGESLCLLRLDVGSCRESARHRHHMITLLFGLVWPRTKCGNHRSRTWCARAAPGVTQLPIRATQLSHTRVNYNSPATLQ